ncbi:uncharacterized protein HD556DRAFT_86571 [Suillus plorans]|uniref:Uncharacterized protein n=1 Tax=Suillus plorans TaxID=116603 RepID=A0A9P7ABE9_9AGAM|nr:uncharacterized protein HD556DRAFT_86571 [Suillus plorans]KAG1785918.1 hypothetical protein HD556DRAFT_86571 [Suillus plorans]KAG1822317.1 hypothetical protein EV424DRAFT_806101 [Suillus variegatus]
MSWYSSLVFSYFIFSSISTFPDHLVVLSFIFDLVCFTFYFAASEDPSIPKSLFYHIPRALASSPFLFLQSSVHFVALSKTSSRRHLSPIICSRQFRFAAGSKRHTLNVPDTSHFLLWLSKATFAALICFVSSTRQDKSPSRRQHRV